MTHNTFGRWLFAMSVIRVYPKLKTIFVHLPKTGGITIKEYLSSVGEEKRYWGHVPTRFRRFDCFTVVRNPFDRFISSWRFCVAEGHCPEMPPHKFLPYALDNDFPLFARPGVTGEDRKRALVKHHTAPQTTPRFCLNQAKTVYRFENFPDVIDSLADRYGFEPNGIKLNPSPRGNLHDYYDGRLADLVRDYFAEDFEALGYDLTLPIHA